MIVLGDRYATVRGSVDGRPHVLKLQDRAVPGRRPVLCHRELLGARLGGAAGVRVPPTRLIDDPALGRLSAQLEIGGARRLSATEQAALRATPLGFRLALLDVAIDNRDRHRANLLIRGPDVFAIDHGAAFAFPGRRTDECAAEEILGRWLGVAGIVGLTPHDGGRLVAAATVVGEALAGAIDDALAAVPARFLDSGERARLRDRLCIRAVVLPAIVDEWWRRTVAPMHRIIREEVGAHG